MTIRENRRADAVERMADYLLEAGLSAASLRPLAAAAGTSDRMLLYYFADRDELLVATLTRIAERLTAMLDAALPPGTRLDFKALLIALRTATGSPALVPYMRVWLELAAGSSQHRQPEQGVAHAIMAGFEAWVVDHLDDAEPAAAAALLLAVLEGALFLDAVGRRDLADAAVAHAAR